ncbi:MAG: transglutaminase domain-containing protein, partial [Candidatus Hadarchaeota archaeon]|nr:transglutaminase domain-containing protein [Candidatus Hadarchaeota archaeon]
YLIDDRSGWASQAILEGYITLNGSSISPEIITTPDNRLAHVELGEIAGHSSKMIRVTKIAKVDHIDLEVEPGDVHGEVPTELQMYTEPVDHLWQSDNPTLENKALELTENEPNLYLKAKTIFNFVEDYLTYEKQIEEHDALWAYNHQGGDCTEFTNLFITLCRAAGIPAKFISGYLCDLNLVDQPLPGHAFAYIYLPNVGWATVDLTWNHPTGQFCELTNDHLIELTSDGSDLVKEGRVKIPSCRVKYNYVGANPNLSIEETGMLTYEVNIRPTIYLSPQLEDRTGKFTVTINNNGGQSVSKVSVRLEVDETYFSTPTPQNVGDLGGGLHQNVYFEVQVKESIENSPVRAVVTYDTPYGTFQAQETSLATVTLQESAPETQDFLLVILIAVATGAAIGLAIGLLRR